MNSIGVGSLELLHALTLVLLGSEALMNDLEGITNSVVLSLKGPKTCQNLVVNALNKDDLLKRIIVLNLPLLLPVLSLNTVFNCARFDWNIRHLSVFSCRSLLNNRSIHGSFFLYAL